MSFRSGHYLFGAIGSAIMAGTGQRKVATRRGRKRKEDSFCVTLTFVRLRELEVCPSPVRHTKSHALSGLGSRSSSSLLCK